MKAYQLKALLHYLTLVGQNEDGELEWIGTDQQWRLMESTIKMTELLLNLK